MPVISITRLRIRKALFLPGFFLAAMRIGKQARASQGNLAVRVFADSHKAFWTATAWSSEAAMRAFMLTEPHGPAMRKLLDWCDEAALVHWTQPDAALPTWPEAHRRLIAEGRPSKVNHPTPAHTAHTPAPPKAEIKIK
ncbi:MAG: DUF3291 domain-containing protein [Terracidiphilus sp.]